MIKDLVRQRVTRGLVEEEIIEPNLDEEGNLDRKEAKYEARNLARSIGACYGESDDEIQELTFWVFDKIMEILDES
jgi:hypothetical protein